MNEQCSTTIQLRWETVPEQDRNGIIIGYTIKVLETETQNAVTRTSTSTNIEVNGLQPFTAYNCSVAAYTTVGTGPSAYLIVTTCEDGEIDCDYDMQ